MVDEKPRTARASSDVLLSIAALPSDGRGAAVSGMYLGARGGMLAFENEAKPPAIDGNGESVSDDAPRVIVG